MEVYWQSLNKSNSVHLGTWWLNSFIPELIKTIQIDFEYTLITQKDDEFVLKGMIEYIRDYLKYEIEKYKLENGSSDGFKEDLYMKENEIYWSLERVYDLFIRFIVAWNGMITIHIHIFRKI